MSDAWPHILVVDDDAEIGALLVRYLGGQSFRVSTAGNGAELRAAIQNQQVDLILLDLGLPDEDGLSLLREFQRHWHGSVIVISGRGESIDRIVGLELGADDYISKPFDLRELLARIRSVLRRTRTESPPVPASSTNRIEFDGLQLDVTVRRLIDRSGQHVELTGGEFDLLQAFLERSNQVLSRDQLMNCLHGRDAGPFDRSIDVQIGRLRRKIETDPANPQLIKSVRGAGYLFTASIRQS